MILGRVAGMKGKEMRSWRMVRVEKSMFAADWTFAAGKAIAPSSSRSKSSQLPMQLATSQLENGKERECRLSQDPGGLLVLPWTSSNKSSERAPVLAN